MAAGTGKASTYPTQRHTPARGHPRAGHTIRINDPRSPGLDGAGLALHGRIAGIPYDRVRMGLRVEAVWTEGGRYPDHYRPTGEPDARYDTYKELL